MQGDWLRTLLCRRCSTYSFDKSSGAAWPSPAASKACIVAACLHNARAMQYVQGAWLAGTSVKRALANVSSFPSAGAPFLTDNGRGRVRWDYVGREGLGCGVCGVKGMHVHRSGLGWFLFWHMAF